MMHLTWFARFPCEQMSLSRKPSLTKAPPGSFRNLDGEGQAQTCHGNAGASAVRKIFGTLLTGLMPTALIVVVAFLSYTCPGHRVMCALGFAATCWRHNC